MIKIMNNQNSERERREAALAALGGDIVDEAREVAGREIRQMVSVRVEPELISALREIAVSRGVNVSDLLREAAAKMVADYRTPTVSMRVLQVSKSAQIVANVSASWGSDNFSHREPSGSFGYKTA
jgi:Arc/MetJ-type ribon-helix-helix transcriptional regulator